VIVWANQEIVLGLPIVLNVLSEIINGRPRTTIVITSGVEYWNIDFAQTRFCRESRSANKRRSPDVRSSAARLDSAKDRSCRDLETLDYLSTRLPRLFANARDRAGLPANFRLHSLRHACSTQELKDGVSPKIVSARRGQSSVAFTLDTYVDYHSDMQHEVTERQQQRFYG
jgi:integrase